MDVKKTGCWLREVSHWSNCVVGDSGVLAGLASPCPDAAILLYDGHMKRCATSFTVALVPGCDRSWTD
jgi:hypothetical protein